MLFKIIHHLYHWTSLVINTYGLLTLLDSMLLCTVRVSCWCHGSSVGWYYL